jgi:Holliday junction resolvasome RuvABC ATP-dependent DNA helicase subunit
MNLFATLGVPRLRLANSIALSSSMEVPKTSAVRTMISFNEDELISIATTRASLQLLQVDDEGLDYIDHKMMNCILEQYKGGPVGLDTIAVCSNA